MTSAKGPVLMQAGGRRASGAHGRYGPLRDGELERARAWGAELASRVATASTG